MAGVTEIDETPTARAIRLAGGPTRVAAALQIGQSSVCEWKQRNRIPLERLPDIAAMVRGKMRPHEIRPDFFGRLRDAARG